MDLKVSRKEQRMQPSGTVEVLVSNIFDVYPTYDNVDKNMILDIDILDGDRVELIDRAMFRTCRQRGSDPLDVTEGIQWAEAVIGEVHSSIVMAQIQAEVQKEGAGVTVAFSTITAADGKTYMQYALKLTDVL